jgi:hypothetical protein
VQQPPIQDWTVALRGAALTFAALLLRNPCASGYCSVNRQ